MSQQLLNVEPAPVLAALEPRPSAIPDEQATLFAQLVAILDGLNNSDEKNLYNSWENGTTVVWTDEEGLGQIQLTVWNYPGYLCVRSHVQVTPVWQEYMTDRERNNINSGFCFDEEEGDSEFGVNNEADATMAIREMQRLNWIRLNWRQQIERRLVLAMGMHSRLGEKSKIALIPEDKIVEIIGKLI